MRLATFEEALEINYKVSTFGTNSVIVDKTNSKFIIEGGHCVAKYELDGLINHFSKTFTFDGYNLSLPNINDLVIAFGCKSGTFKEALEIQKLMNE